MSKLLYCPHQLHKLNLGCWAYPRVNVDWGSGIQMRKLRLRDARLCFSMRDLVNLEPVFCAASHIAKL